MLSPVALPGTGALDWHPRSPFEGLRQSPAVLATSPPRGPPLMGFAALQSVVCDGVARHWVSCSRLGAHRFRSALAVFRPSPSPEAFASGSSSRALSFPPESLGFTAGPAKPGTFHGLPALIATSTNRVHARGHPKPASFRPRRFARPRRLAPLSASRVYFTPLPRPGFALQGFPLARSRTGSSPASCPLVVCAVPLPPVSRRRQSLVPAFRALLLSRVRDGRRRFRSSPARSPRELHPPSGSPSRTAKPTFTGFSDHGLSRPSSSAPCAT